MKRTLDGIEYSYIDPTGNITILVESDVSANEYAAVAKRLMDAEKECEQVGYVKKSKTCDIGLDMAAGEFCGNATMSAAALFCDNEGLKCGEKRRVTVESSGADDPVVVDITREEDNGSYRGCVKMPVPRGIIKRRFEHSGRKYDLPVVDMNGISHIISSSEEIGLPDEQIEDALKMWWEDIRSSCLGIILADNVSGSGDSSVYADVRPLVYAPDVETCFWESSCASGTTALFCFMNDSDKTVKRLVAREAGGELAVSRSEDGAPVLEGTVRL